MTLSTPPSVGTGPTAVGRCVGVYVSFCSCYLRQGTEFDGIQIQSISVSPDPPKPGQNLTVIVEAYAQEEVRVRLHAYFCCSNR
jgi:hypothetical protein